MTFAITVGKYGGFYVNYGYVKRICIGWIAIDFYPETIDVILNRFIGRDSDGSLDD